MILTAEERARIENALKTGKAPESDVARLLVSNLQTVGKSVEDIRTEVSAVVARVADIEKKSFDLKAIMDEYEKQRAAFERVARQLRGGRGPGHFAGIEDAGEKFSLMRAFRAIRRNNWDGAKHEQAVLNEVRKTSSSEIGWRGSYFMPTAILADMIAAIMVRSVFIRLGAAGDGTTRISVLGNMPSKVGKIGKVAGGCLSYWIGEEDEFTESVFKSGDLDVKLKKLGCLTKITQEMLEFDTDGYETMLRADMVNSMATKLDWTIAYGTGTGNMPLGIIRNPDVNLFSAATSAIVRAKAVQPTGMATSIAAVSAIPNAGANVGGELDFDDCDEMIGSLEDRALSADASAVFLGHPRYFRRLKKIKVAQYTGQTEMLAYLLGRPRLPDAQLAEVIGPFDRSVQFASTNKPGQSVGWPTNSTDSKFGDVIFGNMADVVLAMASGMDIEDDGGTGVGFKSDHTFVKTRMWADTLFRRPESLTVCPDARMRD